jgi:tetratricopeptide (TPR) repeat protein
MYGRKFFAPLFFIAAFAFGSISVFAQGAVLKGKVVQKKGSASTPVAGVTVTCYNVTDFTQLTNSTCGTAKTDQQGAFSISGLSSDAKFIIALGGGGIAPIITLPVNPSEKEELITVKKGDGKMPSKYEVWVGFAFTKVGSSFTEEQKQAQAQYEKLTADITAKEKSSKDRTDKLNAILKEGNDAYAAKNYTMALAKYEEGLKLAPDYILSAPLFLNNRAEALKRKAIENYIAAGKSNDSQAVSAAKSQAEKELGAALDAVFNSYTLIVKDKPTNVQDKAVNEKNKFRAIDQATDVADYMFKLHVVDSEKAEIVKTLVGAYLNLVKDSAKKGKAQRILANYLMEAYDYTAAIVEYKKALKYAKNDPDIIARIGLALYSTGEKANSQEALNYIDYFLKIAPPNHEMRSGMPEIIKDLTKNQKLKPQKIN